MATNFSPKFIKAKLSFEMDQKSYDIGDHLIQPTGVFGFPWEQFDPMESVGTKCVVKGEIQCSTPFAFQSEAFLNCEETQDKRTLGLTFNLQKEQDESIKKIIQTEGVLPDFARKYPRIAFTEKASVMPSRAILYNSTQTDKIMLCADIVDLSPTGFQVCTEDLRCALISPGQIWHTVLQPRGGFASTIILTGEVKRIIHSTSVGSGNSVRFFSMRVTEISPSQKALFTDLLRQIILFFG